MSALEVGSMFHGTKKLEFVGGYSYDSWKLGEANTAGGMGVKHKIYNASGKSMKYITFVYVPYNQVGDVVACKTSGKSEARARLTGPFNAGEESVVEWEVIWYNTTITSVVLKEVLIEYMDGTEETVKGEDLVSTEDKNSEYYKNIQCPRDQKEAEEKAKREIESAKHAKKVKLIITISAIAFAAIVIFGMIAPYFG